MKLTVKDMDIATGGVLIAILNEEDARRFDLHHEDRIIVKKGKKSTTAVVDIAESTKAVPVGKIGLFEEVMDKVHAKHNDTVEIDIQDKPKSVQFIRKKLDGKKLNSEEINTIIADVVSGKLTDTELAYFVGACYTKELELSESVALTQSIVNNGSHLKFNKSKVMDKHCSGGVPGNRTTMVVVPILAAVGLTVPKTSSRSITSPAGTADTMEVLCPVSMPLQKVKKVINTTNACLIWGGAVDLATADDKLIRVRHSLSLDPEGMLLASILAKKKAVGSTHVLIDIPLGRDTKIKTKKRADHLKRLFIKIGARIGMKVKVIITDGTQPVGNGIGPLLEARDVLWLFRRSEKRPLDLEEKSLDLAEVMLGMAGIKNARKKAMEILASGEAYQKFQEIIKAQGGDPNVDPDKMKLAKFSYTYNAPKTGTVRDIDNRSIAKIARIAGAPKDQGAGIYLYKHEKYKVKKGEPVFTIYSDNKMKLQYAVNILKKFDGIVIS